MGRYDIIYHRILSYWKLTNKTREEIKTDKIHLRKLLWVPWASTLGPTTLQSTVLVVLLCHFHAFGEG